MLQLQSPRPLQRMLGGPKLEDTIISYRVNQLKTSSKDIAL